MKKMTIKEFEKFSNLVYSYDIYTRYIEDYNQEKEAERKNKKIFGEIKEMVPEFKKYHIEEIKSKKGDWKEKLKEILLNECGIEIEEKSKRIWTEDEIKNLIQTNDKVLYAAFKKLYACQTADEQHAGHTQEYNGVGFNGVDAPILSSMAEFLIKTGFLTPKQKVIVRKKLVKYNKQLTKLANA